MKVTYVKTKDTDLDIPEYIEEGNRVFEKYLVSGLPLTCSSIEDGMYLSISEDDENEVEYIVFADDKFTNGFISMFSKFNLLIDTKDITTEVKSNMCTLPIFTKLFKSEDSSYREKSELEIYLDLYTTSDDILDKINIYGIDCLTEKDNQLLK